MSEKKPRQATKKTAIPKRRKAQKRLLSEEDWPEPLLIAYEGKRAHSIFGRFPRHTKLLGVIAGLWGTLEHQMGRLFEELMHPRTFEARDIYYALGNHKARRDILRVAGKRRLVGNPILSKKLDKVIDLIGKRADRRNDIIHSSWVYFADADTMLRYSPRPMKKDAQHFFHDKEQDLLDFIERLKEAINQTTNLIFDVLDFRKQSNAPPLG